MNTKSDNNKPGCCAVHTWPRAGHKVLRSIGVIRSFQCNNCPALRIEFSVDVQGADGEWRRVTNTQIVEPDFSAEDRPYSVRTPGWR